MQGLRKSKKVTWASGVNLCQVKLFLSEDCPSQAGAGAQDHLQEILHSGPSSVNDDNLPPGFEARQPPASAMKNKLAHIPVITWICPSKFELSESWRTAEGEESEEVESQNKREMRVLEAIYPRPSAIPPNPCELAGLEDEPFLSEEEIPIIPVTPIEDEDQVDTTDPPSMASSATSQGGSPASSNGADLVAAAQAALSTAAMTNNQGSLIDHNLLMRILADPQMIARLVRNHAPPPPPPPAAPPVPPPVSTTQYVSPPPVQPNGVGAALAYPPRRIGVAPPASDVLTPPPPPPPMAKDINYFKSLIQQHGGERQDNMPPGSGNMNMNMNPHLGLTNSRPKNSKKPCMYYNSTRGCRNGAKCAFQHDVITSSSSSGQGQQRGGMSTSNSNSNSDSNSNSSKRMKLDREITGT